MDYDLTGLGSRSFEQMTQALCVASLGAGVVVFGDGPDGGREATHTGALPMPEVSGDNQWDGYTVMQAKHHLHPGTPAQNASWLAGQLRRELDMFLPSGTQRAKRGKRPEYYLLVTNVRLSSTQDTGGLDAIKELLDSYAEKLEMRGYGIWSYDQVCRLLDANPGVRRTYAGAVTSGDLIAALLDIYRDETSDIGTRLSVNATVELQARQWVRLGDAGLEHEGKLELTQVAVDVPALIVDPSAERADWSEVKVINHILTSGGESRRKSSRGDEPQGIVVVGGPGQGKSTVAQIVCQAYRTAMLQDSAALKPTQEILVGANKAAIHRIGLEIPTYRRWPVYVELSKLGDAIAADDSMSLLKFVASQIKAGGGTVLPNELSKWQKNWPWLLVLDGLDEVAALTTRAKVVAAISEFLTDVDFRNDDVFVVATTRPQGYKGELGELDPQQLELRALTPTEANKYGQLLVRARLYDDKELANQVVQRLDQAAADKVTARLMTTPLQVTIMETLLEGVQRVPETRHALFDEYYKSIYRREETKAGTLGALLSTHKDVIDDIHEQVGLYLHVKAELEGQSEALLPDGQLERLFLARLQDDGHNDAERLAAELTRAAKDRVVLLVAARAEYVGFEVRSLQEYMAARALVNVPEALALDRLDAVASSTHWRNTWLLAAGRVFESAGHQREALLTRVRNLDTNSAVGMIVGIGERLALDMLEDDFAMSIPKHRRALVRHAVAALEQWADPQLRRLAVVLVTELDRGDKVTVELIKTALTRAFESNGQARGSAVLVLRSWEKLHGTAGALSRLLLGGNRDWRPHGSEKRKRAKVGDVLAPVFSPTSLGNDQRRARERILKLLNGHYVTMGVTASEAATYAKNFQQTISPEFQQLLADDAVLEAFIESLGQVDAANGEVAIFVRQLIVTLSERQVVGTDPVVADPSSGLFALERTE